MRIVAGDGVLGARVEGIDLARPLDADSLGAIRAALGERGVLCFPGQALSPAELSAFGARFGALELNVANTYHAPGHPEVMILSNITRDGLPIGFADAGQGWHTDMSYSRDIALATLLHAKTVPMRDGAALGATEFRDMHLAYAELPPAMKARLEGLRAVHDFAKFWDMMRAREGSARPPLTPAQRQMKPPVAQPIVRVHPITGRKVLYCNLGYAVTIAGLAQSESAALLEFLDRHQAQDKYRHAHLWTEGDVLMWDDIGTTHNAVADYGADEPRFMYRVQVIAPPDPRA